MTIGNITIKTISLMRMEILGVAEGDAHGQRLNVSLILENDDGTMDERIGTLYIAVPVRTVTLPERLTRDELRV